MSGSSMLTPAEQRVFDLLVETPDTYKVIARSLGVALQTVGTHAESIFRKLGYSCDGGVQPRIALILAHHEAVIRGLDKASLRTVECSCQTDHSTLGVCWSEHANRQRPVSDARPSPVVGRAGDAQDGMMAAAEPGERR